jgi:glycosyltransferase involved in cell wall biosynthesis
LKQTKLLLVSPCQGTYGGIEAFVLALADAIRREPDFTVKICLKKVRNFVLHPSLAEMFRHDAVMFVDRAGSQLADAIRWSDIIHLQNASPDVICLAKFFRKPIVLTIHNYMPRRLNAHRLLWKMGARFADARWYNSNFVWRTWEGDRPRAGSRRVATTSKLPEGWTPLEERRGFVFVGRWIANKGIETLVDAYFEADLDREAWPLTLIGDGPLRASIEDRLQKYGVRGVQLPGFVGETTKAQRMRNARWVVVPPHTNEDFGLTAIEARNLGVPCIITRDGGLPEAGGSQALVCEPNNAPALARLLEQAAGMSTEEYARRSQRTKEELADEMEPMEFYAQSYRRILRGESLG